MHKLTFCTCVVCTILEKSVFLSWFYYMFCLYGKDSFVGFSIIKRKLWDLKIYKTKYCLNVAAHKLGIWSALVIWHTSKVVHVIWSSLEKNLVSEFSMSKLMNTLDHINSLWSVITAYFEQHIVECKKYYCKAR